MQGTAPPPWRVSNQWEGVQLAAAEEKEVVEEEGESDVIVVEWASEGVQYDNIVEDRED